MWLDENNLTFPDTRTASEDPNGLLALGGDLSVARLVAAYRQGIFPWYDESEQQPILWWTPNPRAVLIPKQLRINRSLRKQLRRQNYHYSFNQCFNEVVAACQAPRSNQQGTWIGSAMSAAYYALHTAGFAHSVEVWQEQTLVGGLYGIVLDKVFFGESMFSCATSASQCALVILCQQLIQQGFHLIDCQIESEYLTQMGAQLISRNEFEKKLQAGISHTRPDKQLFSAYQQNKNN